MENTYMFKIGINLNYAECYRRYKIEQHFKLKKQQESLLTSYCYQTFARKPRYLCKLLSSEMWTVPRVSPASPETVQTVLRICRIPVPPRRYPFPTSQSVQDPRLDPNQF